jgi:hypothetical protein
LVAILKPPMEAAAEIKMACSLDLFEYISWQTDYPDEAANAFKEFSFRFERDVIRMSEVACSKWGYDEIVAFDISNCVFQRVWKYPSYNQEKSKSKDINKGVKLWLHRIVYTQLANYKNKGFCYEADKETDLTLIETIEDFVEGFGVPDEKRRIILKTMKVVDEALSHLTHKHKIIYLTYKLYCPIDKTYIPRAVSKKLQEELGLAQGSIRKYKEEANKIVATYLNRING